MKGRIKRKLAMFLCMIMVLSCMSNIVPVRTVQAEVTESTNAEIYSAISTDKGLSFEADTCYATDGSLKEGYPYTISSWVYLPSGYEERGGVIFGNFKDTKTPCVSFEIYTDGQPRFYHLPNVKGLVFDEVTICDDEWVNLTFVVSGNTVSCYKNGVLAQSKTTTKTIDLPSVTNQYVLGGDLRSDNTSYFKGKILELVAYGETLSADEVAALYTEGVGAITDKEPIAYYDLEDGKQGRPISDASGSGNHLFTSGIHTDISTDKGLSFGRYKYYATDRSLKGGYPYTISSWVYLPSDFTDRGGVIFGNFKDATTPCVSFEIYSDGQPRFYHCNGEKYGYVLFDKVTICDDEWVNLTFVVSGNTVSCYKNGVLAQTQEVDINIDLASVTNQYVLGGDLRSGNAQYFKGEILELVAYGETLSGDEVATLYTEGVGAITDRKLLASYDLEDAIEGQDILDLSNNGNKLLAGAFVNGRLEPLSKYAYSFAVVGDTQIVVENDVNNETNDVSKIYDWIVANKDSKNIQYVFGLGDVTDNNVVPEYEHALESISKLDGVVPYSLVRGNHDMAGRGDSTLTDRFSQVLGTTSYRNQFSQGGFYTEDNISNSWCTLTVGEIDYLMLALDFGATDEMLEWANQVIAEHPTHNVIITTHAYLYKDGTTLGTGDASLPSSYNGKYGVESYNNGDDIWEKLVKNHENIVLVMCGHIPSDEVVVSEQTGVNGNIVKSLLIDPQDVDDAEGSTGMVTMLYFSEDGHTVQVETYSTVREKYFMYENQYTFEVAVVDSESTGGAGEDKADSCERVVKSYTAQEAKNYLDGDNSYPSVEGYLFAGWYTKEVCDSTCMLAGKTPTDTVYALFVPKHVLSIKAQVSANLLDENTENDSTGSIRFVTTVDSLLYQEVGFEISYVDNNGYTYKAISKSNTVYEKLYVLDSDKNVWDRLPRNTFCAMSAYFRTCTLRNLSTDYFATEFTVTPYWITTDGDKVFGVTETKTINQGIAESQ